MRIGLETYTFAYSTGLAYRHLQPDGFVPIRGADLLIKAHDAGLSGLSVDLGGLMSPTDHEQIIELRRMADRYGMFLAAATGGTEVDRLTECLKAAHLLGANVLRTVIGGAALGGDRRNLSGQWKSFLADRLADLRQLVRVAERYRVTLAVENHQDLTSDELLWLVDQLSSPWFGIILDVANPLGTAEEPRSFYEKVIPYVKGAHLKDYVIKSTPSGYLLCRCALGDGVIDFPALFDLFNRYCPDICPTVELAALEARHVRVLEPDFWPEYPERPAAELARTWRFVQEKSSGYHVVGSDDDESKTWKTPVERGLRGDAIAAYEEEQFDRSMRYLRLVTQRPPNTERIVGT